MSVYLHDIPLSEAQNRLEQALRDAGCWRILGVESILLDENALGRVLAEPVWARNSSPHYHASAMDGFVVRAEMTAGAMPSTPVILSLGGDRPEAAYVDTGDLIPDWANAVIPIENVEPLDAAGALTSNLRKPAAIRIRASVAPWSHIRPLGEDIVATQLVLPAGHTLRAVDLGAIAASGHDHVNVSRRPRVAILPTGTELVPIGVPLKPGDILEYNSLVLAAQVKTMGADPTRYPITPDDFDAICKRVAEAAQNHDLVLLNAGSSAGSEDFSSRVVETLGELLVHGVAVRPGHPVILGLIHRPDGSSVPIIGVPGYPVSAALTVEIFVEPLIATWLGRQPLVLPEISAQMTRKTVSPPGDDDYVRVVMGKVGERVLVAPLSRGAGVITSLVRADGLVVLPRGVQGVEAGEAVRVRLYRSQAEIENTILCIGSHDVILDLIAQFLSRRGRRFSSANVGSQGGLVALRRGEAHMSGTHLLDPETGQYNLVYLKQYVPGVAIKLITLVGREQGLLVKPGNPKGIFGLADLVRDGITFINRQRGAGTRVLLDYHLKRMGLSSDWVKGYADEEYTHLGVAAAVASGRADTGLGIAAAARALNLDFIPLFQERYDLAIPKIYAESPLLEPFFDILNDLEFRQAVMSLPGYDISKMGNLVVEV